jgi:hypothetical protein
MRADDARRQALMPEAALSYCDGEAKGILITREVIRPMTTDRVIGSPVFLALLIIFGGAGWAVLGVFGADTSSLEAYALLLAAAVVYNLVYMVKKIVKPPELRPQGLGLDAETPPKRGQKEGIKEENED